MQVETRASIGSAMLYFAIYLRGNSHCTRGQHACVLADRDMQVLSYGYNGVAVGFPNTCHHPTESGRCGCVHAEANALAKPRLREPYYAFITGAPCAQCAQLLMNAGVRRIVYVEETTSFHDPLVGGAHVLAANTVGVLYGPHDQWDAALLPPS